VEKPAPAREARATPQPDGGMPAADGAAELVYGIEHLDETCGKRGAACEAAYENAKAACHDAANGACDAGRLSCRKDCILQQIRCKGAVMH
jgi:hypothetical protein